ncbi:MAG: protein kinase [Acidobacteria bacterium]|nr:protein kinase [Acidobacteriota bacterium]
MVPAGETAARPRKRIGKYLVTGRIGRGGMGMVYRAWDEVLEREVAVKTLTVEGTLDEESRKRFEIEAKAAARLQHPNILTVFELGEDRGVPFIAMELLPGIDLEALLRSAEEILLQERLDVVVQVCRGLAYAHEHRIVHRDIKPSNIRILDDGSVKIMDFGIAKLQGTGVTKAGMMVGTVHYMSPEQIRGKSLDGRSDVFSVGVILYEILAGRRPFSGETATEVLYRIVHEPAAPLPLPEDLGSAGPRLQEIVDRALAKEPDQRFSSATEMADAVAGVLLAHRRPGADPAQEQEAVAAARRLLKEGRAEESLRHLRELAERRPDSLDLRRALRAATRETQRRQRAAEPAAEEFPELDATFQAPPTQMSPETATVLQPTELAARHSAVGPPRIGVWIAVGVGAALVVGGGLAVLLRGGPGEDVVGGPVKVAVRSRPPGAVVLLDGKETGVVTDGEVLLPEPRRGLVRLTFRKDGFREETRTIALPLPDGEVVSVTLGPAPAAVAVVTDPPGASVTLDGQRVPGTTPLDLRVDPSAEHRLTLALDGHASQEVRLAAGRVPPQVRVGLSPSGPMGSVTVTASYPVDVVWRGRILARGQTAPRVSVPQGRQVLTLLSPGVFLRANVTVEVRRETAVAAPPLGTLNIRATPDNCEVFVDGASVGYLPILDRPVSAGRHAVLFRWPDGGRSEDAVEVVAGRPAFVVGRRDP